MKIANLTEEDMRSQIEGCPSPNMPGVDFLNCNMFVEAGAGAGKTTLIVRRIVNQLKRGDEPGSFVVITFTNAAAEELRGRIAAKVKAEGLTDALAHLDEMNISTIHSFCNVLLKEQSILAGLPQQMDLMEEEESSELKHSLLGSYMSTLNSGDWDKLEADVKSGTTRWQIKGDIEKLFIAISDLPADTRIETPRQLNNIENALNNKDKIIQEIYVKFMECIKSVLNPNEKPEKRINYNTLDDVPDDERSLSSKSAELLRIYKANKTDAAKLTTAALVHLLGKSGKYFKTTGLTKAYLADNVVRAEQAFYDYVEERIAPLRQMSLKPDVDGDEDDNQSAAGGNPLEALSDGLKKERHYRCVLDYAKKAKEYYLANKPKGKISNDNLLELTRNLICNENDTRALYFFSKKYKHFYVDEFQDTDRIQESFIYRLASDLSDPAHHKLRDGALFVVGDPKQSIYRFRGAQPEVYFDVKERMSDSNLTNTFVYELARNYRSNKKVIEWINEKFIDSNNFTPIALGSYSYQPMEPVKQSVANPADPDKLLSGVYHYKHSDATYMGKVVQTVKGITSVVDGLIYSVDDIDSDIAAVVNLILNLKNQGYTITKYRDDAEHTPYEAAINFRDFLLIVQNMKEMEKYLEALKAYGIPVSFAGRAKLSEDKVLITYSRLFWYLVNPKEPFHRTAAQEAIRESGLTDNLAELDKYTDLLLDDLYARCKGMSAFAKAFFLKDQLAVLLEKNRTYDVIEIYSARTRLQQMVEAVISGTEGTGVQLAEGFAAYIAGNLEHELSMEEEPDAVRLMNLHKSKGLEGEIVIILKRDSISRTKLVDMRDGSTYYPGIPSWSSVSGISIYADKNKAEEEAEFHRLEYVAITRAKQAVIFMNTIKHGGIFCNSSTLLAPKSDPVRAGREKTGYNYHIDETPSVEAIITSKTNSIMPASTAGSYDFVAEGYGVSTANEAGYKPLYVTINPSGLEKSGSATKNMERRKNVADLGASGLYNDYQESFARPKGNILGNVLHRTMELVIDRFTPALTAEEEIRKVTNFCTRQAVNENVSDIPAADNAESYYEFVSKAAAAYYGWLLETGKLSGIKAAYTELPFSFFEEDDKNSWHHGTADLILEYTNGRFCLIDYKSDDDFLVSERIMEIGLAEKYGPQIEEYRGVIERMFKANPEDIEAGIVSFSMKDEFGSKLENDKLRVRYTKL